jgi:hypothetical protein
VTPLLLAATLLATAAPETATVREQRRIGLALAPGLAFHDVGGQFGGDGFIMPLAAAVDGVFAHRWAAALSVARFPASYGAVTHLHAGARRYLLDGLFSPYLCADLGLEFEGVESGSSRTSPFATGGAGVELSWRPGAACCWPPTPPSAPTTPRASGNSWRARGS